MGDDEHRARRTRATSSSRSAPALDVEMRLGLVEQQDVGAASTRHRRERDELALAAAERARRAVEVGVAHAEITQHARIASPSRRAAPSASRCSSSRAWRSRTRVMRSQVGGERGVGELRLDAGEVGLERGDVGPRVADRLADGALVAGDELREVGDDRAAPQRDRAGVGRRRRRRACRSSVDLPAAVGADQPDPRAGRADRGRGRRGSCRPPNDFTTPRALSAAGAVGAVTAMAARTTAARPRGADTHTPVR